MLFKLLFGSILLLSLQSKRQNLLESVSDMTLHYFKSFTLLFFTVLGLTKDYVQGLTLCSSVQNRVTLNYATLLHPDAFLSVSSLLLLMKFPEFVLK